LPVHESSGFDDATACVLLSAALRFAAGSGFAQDTPPFDVGVAYSFLRIYEEDGLNMPAGWLASIAGRATNRLSVVGEVAGNYKSESGETFNVHTFQGGVRVLSRQNPNVRPYGQFLLGGKPVWLWFWARNLETRCPSLLSME
jgi:hypothetical protein